MLSNIQSTINLFNYYLYIRIMEKQITLFDKENKEYKLMVSYDYIPVENIQGSSSFDYDLPNWVEDFENCYLSWTLLPDQILPNNYYDQIKDYKAEIKSQLQ